MHKTVEGSSESYRYEYWVSGLILLAGLVLTPVGWFARKQSARIGYTLLILGQIAAVGVAPSLFQDQIVIHQESFHVQTGFWCAPTVHDVSFKDVNRARHVSEISTGRRGKKKTNYYLLCELKSGGSSKVPLNNNVAEAAAEPIFRKLTEQGITVVDET